MAECGQFNRQFRVLAWKNFKLKIRYPLMLFLELAIPTIIIIALGVVKLQFNPSPTPETFPNIFTPISIFDSLYVTNKPACTDENLVWRCGQKKACLTSQFDFMQGCEAMFIAVAPDSESNSGALNAAQDFISYMGARSKYAANYSTFQLFPSEDTFVEYISSASYSVDSSTSPKIYSSAVIFSAGYPSWDYTLRLNQSYYISGSQFSNTPTSVPVLDISLKTGTDTPSAGKSAAELPYLLGYIESGTFTLMDQVNSFIASHTLCEQQQLQQDTANCTDTATVNIETVGGVQFPHPETIINGFWSKAGFAFALLIIIALLLPLSNVIKSLVQEKESKLREGMLMMAMRSDALWSSWILHFMSLFLPLSIVLTIASRQLFAYSSPLLVFFYFIVFFVSATSYGILVSAFFDKARTAAIIGSLFFFGGFFVYVGTNSSSSLSNTALLAACLHPSAAFTFGTQAFVEYEDANIGVTFNTWNVSNTYNITFRQCLYMMLVDAVWMGVLSWYVNHIWPSEYGTQKPWYFVFSPWYWLSCLCPARSGGGDMELQQQQQLYLGNVQVGVSPNSDAGDAVVEEVTENLKAQIANNKCVSITNLYKSFHTNTGKKVAVDCLNLTMFSGQITALLGHNGAGKSTTIAMLTGLIPPDGGKALIEGRNLRTDMNAIRQNLGVCPQHDILFPDLTVEEHLIMFASFKGTPSYTLKEEVENMIKSVGLVEKRRCYSKFLSGGQKRKLSVGIAFIGGSRVVFLDEPTSGMDPYSRRFTWNLIRQHREGRVVVLTTHFMDEADLLGDRIAIMGDGKLRCCGSSLFLKNYFGVGYNMTLEKEDVNRFDTRATVDTILTHIPDAKLLGDAGKEMTFQLPFKSSDKFPELFRTLEDGESGRKGIRSYGVSVMTLEEVFIMVARGTNSLAEANPVIANAVAAGAAAASGGGAVGASPYDQSPRGAERLDAAESGKIIKALPILDFAVIPDEEVMRYFARHLTAMIRKRRLYFFRDSRSWIFQYVIPVLFVLVGMLIMQFTSFTQNQPVVSLTTTGLYNTGISDNFLPTPYSAGSSYCYGTSLSACSNVSSQTTLLESLSEYANYPLEAVSSGVSIYDMSVYIEEHRKDYAAFQVGAFSFLNIDYNLTSGFLNQVKYLLHANYTAVFGGPLYASILADAVVKSINKDASVQVSLHPLPRTNEEDAKVSNYQQSLVVTFILLASPFIPAAFATYVVREREVKAKQQQMVSGASLPAYWLANWIWDNLTYNITVWMIVILVSCFPNTEKLSGKEGQLSATIGLLLLYGSAVSGFAYVTSNLFTTPSGAQIAFLFFGFVSGLILSLISLLLRFIASVNSIYINVLRYIFALLPPFALAEGLTNLSFINVLSIVELQGGQTYSPLDWKITGMNLLFLGVESIVFLAAAILYEYLPAHNSLEAFMRGPRFPAIDQALKDEDVLAEEKRCLSGEADGDSTILVKDIRKVYDGGKYAVKGVSLGIPNGECFGLLGVNGAGKTTTLSILCGEIKPSTGEATLSGLSILHDIHRCRRKIGFCPQFDAIFELLTAREHLELYARIKGIVDEDIPRVVEAKINEMGLHEYADRAAGTFSGGNKRKLSVAIAMIGEPSIVFLDEPSTGMDPLARRFMWNIISDIATKREKCSVVLTTHSMEECEALCTRIGIMVGGVMRCLGSAQRLRSRYGQGYQIEIGQVLPDNDRINGMVDTIVAALKGAQQGGTGNDNALPPSSAAMTAAASGTNPIVVAAAQEFIDMNLTREQMYQAFTLLSKDYWVGRITLTGTGADLQTSLNSTSTVSLRHLASWWLLEVAYDNICLHLVRSFGDFSLRERHSNKLRVEISSVERRSGAHRKLSTMFAALESHKAELMIQDYSIAQTSLEQIFNFFAAQQEEEDVQVAGMVPFTNLNNRVAPN